MANKKEMRGWLVIKKIKFCVTGRAIKQLCLWAGLLLGPVLLAQATIVSHQMIGGIPYIP